MTNNQRTMLNNQFNNRQIPKFITLPSDNTLNNLDKFPNLLSIEITYVHNVNLNFWDITNARITEY